MEDFFTVLGKTLTLSQIRLMPNIFRCLALLLDDLWYYRYHRVDYPESARIFMDKIDIINDLRLSPWFLDNVYFS